VNGGYRVQRISKIASKAPYARRRQQQRPAQVRARRHTGELPHDEIEMLFDDGEVGARLIGLTQC
jgi:hypothetical protein